MLDSTSLKAYIAAHEENDRKHRQAVGCGLALAVLVLLPAAIIVNGWAISVTLEFFQ